MSSKRKQLYDLTRESAAKIKKLKGVNDDLFPSWQDIVDDCEKSVASSVKRGEFKYFFDAKEQNMKTTEAIAIELKKRLEDVLIIVSPRGIEINWESPE